MISFEPRVGKAQTGYTSGGFAVIIPFLFIRLCNLCCGNTIYLSIPSRLCPLCECGHALCKSPTFSTFGLDTRRFCCLSREQGMPLPLLYWEVVVPLCLELMLIRHRGGTSLSDVGLLRKACPHSQRGQSRERIEARDVVL